MKTTGKPLIITLLICLFIGSLTGIARSEVDYAAQQRILAVIEGYKADMDKRAEAVAGAIGKARDAGSTDPALWQVVDQRRSEYVQTVQQTLPLIDQMVKNLLAVNPVAQLPVVSISFPFGDVLTEAEADQKEASEFASRFLEAYQFCQNELLRARLDNIEVIQQSMNKFLLKASGVALTTYAGGRIFAPKLVRFTPLTGLLAAVWGLRADADMITTVVQRRQTWERLAKEAWDEYQNLKPALQHFEAVVKSIGVWHQESLKLVEEAKKYGGIWVKDLETAVEKKKQEDEADYQKNKNRQQPTINLGGGSGYIPPIPPLTPADYMGDVNSILSGLESEYKGVRDGGDPKTFEEAGTRTSDQFWQAIKTADEAVKRGHENLEQAQRAYWQACQPIYKRYYEILARGNWCGGCSGYPDVQRLNAQVLAEAEAYLGPALAAAAVPVYAAGAALVEPIRQRSKAGMVHKLVTEGYWKLFERLYWDGQLLAGEFRSLWQQGEAAMWQETGKVYSVAYRLPQSYTIDGYRSMASNLDSWVQGQMSGGASPDAIQSSLLDQARAIRLLDESIKATLPLLEKAQQNAMQEGERTKRELLPFLTKHGKLIAPHFYGYYWSGGGDPVDQIRERVEKTFTVAEWEGLKMLKEANLADLASRFEAKTADLDEAAGWIDLYRGRLSVAAFRLNRISVDVVGKDLYDLLYLNSAQLLRDVEFKKSGYLNLLAFVDAAIPAAYRTAAQWQGPWETRGPKDRLNLAIQNLAALVQRALRFYVQARQYGTFMHAMGTDYQQAIEFRGVLQNALRGYNEKVAPLATDTTALRERAAKFKEPVTAVYDKMPAYPKRYVSDSHQRFLAVTRVLEAYLQGRESAVGPVPETTQELKTTDELLAGYKEAKAEWEEKERQARERAEEQERQRKAEEQRRATEEKQKADSELSLVSALYPAFKAAYESRNDSLVLSFISNSWQAGDGTTISDLQKTLRQTFRVFDEIRYTIGPLSIDKQSASVYRVTYDLTITSKIYKRNITHEEKSNVTDEVLIDQSGKAKIGRTMAGMFWTK
jgi:hypothetical protein